MYSSTCALLSNALVGMQPQLRQMPPKLSFSMIAVLKPSCDALIAATYPPGPLPITTTSYAIMIRLICGAKLLVNRQNANFKLYSYFCPSMKLDILAIGAHPDDIELGCSGTIISEIRNGKKVGIADITQGELGTRGTAETRAQEAADAAHLMGVSVRENLKLPDGFFQNNPENQMKLVRVIRKYQPEIILANAPEDRHPDHGRAARLIADAAFFSGLRKIETTGDDGKAQEA